MTTTVTQIRDVWELMRSQIKEKLTNPSVYDSFFARSNLMSIEGNKVTIGTDSSVATYVLSSQYRALVESVVRSVLQGDYAVTFVYPGDQPETEKRAKSSEKPVFFSKNHIKESYSFDSFVVGDCNREAHQAAIMAVEAPGTLFNPLFIYGSSGLGKTHLLSAIGNAYKSKHANANVLYMTADDFFDEYVRFCNGERRGDELRDFFRNDVDFLLVDDVQQLKGRSQTELTFFSIFNALVAANKQIVITSDTHPDQLDGFDERLKTRFTQGLTLSVNRPDQATAEGILRTKIVSMGMDISLFDDEAIAFVASRFCSNVRELEGRLTRLLFYLSTNKAERVTEAVARAATQDDLEVKNDSARLSEEKILNRVADFFHISASQISGKNRTGQIALARHVTMYLIRDLLDLPFAKIGEFLGGKDHATVMNGVQKVEKSLRYDPELKRTVQTLKSQLKS